MGRKIFSRSPGKVGKRTENMTNHCRHERPGRHENTEDAEAVGAGERPEESQQNTERQEDGGRKNQPNKLSRNIQESVDFSTLLSC